jgi:hypothetical protein
VGGILSNLADGILFLKLDDGSFAKFTSVGSPGPSPDPDIDTWDPGDGITPGSGGGSPGTITDIPTIDVDDTADEFVIFNGNMGGGKDVSGGAEVDIFWTSSTATTGNVVWSVEVSAADPGTGATPGSWGAVNRVSGTAPGTTNNIVKTTVPLSTASQNLLGRDKFFRLRVGRTATNGGDTMTGDARILQVKLRSVIA